MGISDQAGGLRDGERTELADVGPTEAVRHSNATSLQRSLNARSPKWTPAEDEVIRTHYVQLGASGCVKHLSRRARGAINTRAHRLGIVMTEERRNYSKRIYKNDDAIDRVIVEAYRNNPKHGIVKVLAYKTGRSIHWVQKRALELGCRVRLWQPWSEAEKAVLAANINKPTKRIYAAMKAAGFKRSEGGIRYEIRRRGYFRDMTDPNVYSLHFIANMAGVGRATVSGWVDRGLLPSKKTGTGQTCVVEVKRRDFYRFVYNNPTLVDLRKVDQHWFMDLVLHPGNFG